MTPWILCIHNIPPKPPYLRAKVARRLAALGAVAIKNAVYVLPDNAAHRDGLMWLAKEIEDGGGRAFVCAASFDVQAGGMGDDQIESLFVQARDEDYRALAVESRPVFENLGEARDADAARRESRHRGMPARPALHSRLRVQVGTETVRSSGAGLRPGRCLRRQRHTWPHSAARPPDPLPGP